MNTPSDVPAVESPHALVASSDGMRIAVHDLGGPMDSDAPVLLFSHATGFHGRVWEPMAAHLTDRYRCLAIDHRGHGLSLLPPGASLAWSAMGEDTAAVLASDLIDPRRIVHGVGHSMGGAALVLAADQTSASLRSLWLYEPIIAAPSALPAAPASNPMAEAAERRRATFGSFSEAESNFASKPPLDQLHPAALHAYVMGGFAPQADGTVRLRCEPATEAGVFRGVGESRVWTVFSKLELPIAIIAGRPEPFGPSAFIPGLVRSQPRAVLVECPEIGHFGPLEDPAAMAGDLERWIDAQR